MRADRPTSRRCTELFKQVEAKAEAMRKETRSDFDELKAEEIRRLSECADRLVTWIRPKSAALSDEKSEPESTTANTTYVEEISEEKPSMLNESSDISHEVEESEEDEEQNDDSEQDSSEGTM